MSIIDLLSDNNFNLRCNTIVQAGGHEVGWQAGASLVDPVFIGVGATAAGGTGSVAAGNGATVAGAKGVGIGEGAIASGASSLAVGDGAEALGADSVALGQGAKATNAGDISIGRQAGNVPAPGTGVINIAGIPEPLVADPGVGNAWMPILIGNVQYWIVLRAGV